jgi:hypothetical protein
MSAPPHLPEDRRREIFKLLVTAQDLDMTVAESRQMIADMYNLGEAEIIAIEQEGRRKKWPPL